VEAGLEDLVREGLDGGRLTFVLGAAKAVPGAEFVFLCVPTPQADDGSADLSFIRAVAEEIGARRWVPTSVRSSSAWATTSASASSS
jgi:UDPglucose 6-dehydrogenase